MQFEDFLTLKALEAKRLSHGGGDLQDKMLDTFFMKFDGDEFRNICAHIGIPLADEIDNLCSSLNVSKRRFIEGALIDAVKLSNAIVSQVKPFDLEG